MPNVYDFDKTIVYPDAGIDFYLFCLRRHPGLLRYLPRIGVEAAGFAIGSMRKTPVKGEYYRFLRALPDWQEEVRLFWQTKSKTMLKPWYLAQKRPDDIVISCSPDFLLRPFCEQLGVRLIATRVNTGTGRLEGLACYGQEKVRCLHEAFGSIEMEEFYSDSLSDEPLARLAQRAFLVKGDQRTPWPSAAG